MHSLNIVRLDVLVSVLAPIRTVLEPQLPQVQGTLEDVAPARLVFPRHQHQVSVDENCHLQTSRGGKMGTGRKQREKKKQNAL